MPSPHIMRMRADGLSRYALTQNSYKERERERQTETETETAKDSGTVIMPVWGRAPQWPAKGAISERGREGPSGHSVSDARVESGA